MEDELDFLDELEMLIENYDTDDVTQKKIVDFLKKHEGRQSVRFIIKNYVNEKEVI